MVLKDVLPLVHILHQEEHLDENVLLTDYKLTLERWLAARDLAIISMLICTGIRTKEIASLHIDSVDLRERVIKIKGKGDGAHKIRCSIIIDEYVAAMALSILSIAIWDDRTLLTPN